MLLRSQTKSAFIALCFIASGCASFEPLGTEMRQSFLESVMSFISSRKLNRRGL